MRGLGVASGITANDAVYALIWPCILKVRVAVRRKGHPEEEKKARAGQAESGLNVVCGGRANYLSELPETYLRNLTFNVQSSLPLAKLIAPETSLGTVPATLRGSAERINSANLQNLYNLLDYLPSYNELIRLKRKRTSMIDGNNMSISSLMSVPMDSVFRRRAGIWQ